MVQDDAATDDRRRAAVALVGAGLVPVADAARWCGLSRRQMYNACTRAGINPAMAHQLRVLALFEEWEARMAKGMNWSKFGDRNRMRLRGSESAGGMSEAEIMRLVGGNGGQRSPRPRVSKADLRAQAEAAFREFQNGK